jgi:DNA repair ATPase RecN
MAELERILKDTLTRLEQDFSDKLTSQGQTLEEQQRTLANHSRNIQQLQGQNNLKDTLTRLERDLSATLSGQGQTLEEQQRTLAAHSRDIQLLQEESNLTNEDLHGLTQRLEDLDWLCRDLEPLLERLNELLNNS